ncbi:pentapeptide repeat-containing protein [Candidatus Odyssella acanthamoebae]|uniref:pentapeptide repeat-containing protein n=1 Tax=Candidatus Odyssella acanthamoebae TaxID=91604 RepID=UPI0018DB78A7|nr:pentapeptide repeat-containing protein [Candidatus Paracaedibacter acanthamoebae]
MSDKFFTLKLIVVSIILFPLWERVEAKEDDLISLHNQIHQGQDVYAAGFNLHGADLKDLNLKNINFSGANLKEVDFSRTNLKGANFSRANLAGAICEDAEMSKANFFRANLKGANFTGANLNGAKLKEARVLHLKYGSVRSAKGTLFENKSVLLKRLMEEEKVYAIKKVFLAGEIPSIPIKRIFSLQIIHKYLQEKLASLSKKGQEYIILDFRSLKEPPSSSLVEVQTDKAEECLNFLQAPLFRTLVKRVIPICKNQALIIFLQNESSILWDKKPLCATLDLHGKTPLLLKYQWIDNFIQKSCRHKVYAIEIITGRGLHNPEGKMGILWSLCREYLLSKKFQPYVHEIYSISKQGGWRIVLKKVNQVKSVKRKKERFYKTMSFQGANPAFKTQKLILISSDQALNQQEKLTPAVKFKKSKRKSRVRRVTPPNYPKRNLLTYAKVASTAGSSSTCKTKKATPMVIIGKKSKGPARTKKHVASSINSRSPSKPKGHSAKGKDKS